MIKVYADATNGGGIRTPIEDHVPVGLHPKRLAQPGSPASWGFHSRIWRYFFGRVFTYYHRLSWTTRQTTKVSITVLAVLYIFVSVPFRIGFLYDGASRTGKWTKELSIFTALDAIVDLIGVVDFVASYQLWKNPDSNESVDKQAKLVRDTNKRNRKPQLVARTSVALRQGRLKWTLATIDQGSTFHDEVNDSQQNWKSKNWELALEVAALLPLEFIPLAMGTFNWLHLVRVTKLCRGYQLRRCFSQLSTIYADRPWVQHASSAGIRSLVRNAALCVVGCHWAACGYMFIAHAQCGVSLEDCSPDEETSWVVRDRLLGATLARKYGRTIYWAARTMVLLGYDDITPVSSAETVYAIVAQLAGALFCSSTLATFLFIFKFRNARYAAYSEHVDNAREYMHSKNIPRAIRHQVVAYFRYSWNTHHSLDSEGVLRRMPRHLQSKVTATLKASRIRQVCFLAKATVEFINSLALTLERCVYSPHDQIIEPKASAQMFFVIRGNVELSDFNGEHPKDCSSGDFFAEICLLYPEQFKEKAIAKTFCDLYVLAKVKFNEVVTQFHPGRESAVLNELAEVLEKYMQQQRKTLKLLGHSGHDVRSVRALNRVKSDYHSDTGLKGGREWSVPDSSFCMNWETLRLLAVVFVAFEVPFHAVLVAMIKDENMLREPPLITFRYLCTIFVEAFFTIDIVLRARYFAFVDPVSLLDVTAPSLIFDAYKQKGFYLDLIALLPIGLIVDSLANRNLRALSVIFRLPRILRVRLLPSLLRGFRDSRGISSKMHLFISILLTISLTLHLVGVGWFEMAWLPHGVQRDQHTVVGITRAECLEQATQFGNCSWVKFDCYGHVGTVFPAQDSASTYGSSFVYTRAIYWAVVALTAVGYGDIVAFSTPESYFAAVWIFIGGIINLGVLGAMSSTISNVMATRHNHLELLNMVNSVMGRLSISDKLSAEVRRFYHVQFNSRKLAYESQLLSNLPDQLSYQISSLLHANAVKCVDLFDSASSNFLREVTGKFRHRNYQNGETIFIEGDVCREFIVLLPKSRVNVFFRSRKVPVSALHEGDCYGVSEFLLKHSHSVTLVAASAVHVSVMSREQFDALQRKFEDDLKEMRLQAQPLLTQQQDILRRIARNLETQKLKPHVLHTPSLFYSRDGVSEYGDMMNWKLEIKKPYNLRAITANCWTAGTMLWNVYNAFFVFFRIGFHSHLHFSHSASTAVWVADLCGDLYLAMDIYLRLYYLGCPEADLSNLVTRRLVDQGYRRSGGFKWDLVASLPLYVPMASGSLVVSVCRLPRLIRCLDLWTYLDDIIVQVQQHFASRKVSAYLGPVKLMIVVAFASHVVGSIFLFNSDRECERIKNCWLAHDYLIHKYDHALWMIYIKAMYWAITTLLLTSSREIAPRDMVGTLWVIFTCLLCTFAMGYVVGEVTDLILALDKESKEHKGRLASFESFAATNELPQMLRQRVRFFFRAQFESTQGHDLSGTMLQLPASLRIKFLLEIYGPLLMRLPITQFLSLSQIHNLALRLHPELFIPGDTILVEGTQGTRLCVMHKGLATAFWTKSVASVAVLMEGALFGEVGFFLPGQLRLATVRAITSSEVLYISKLDWDELWALTTDPSDIRIQKYALHSILTWVSSRLLRYQQRCVHVARKAKRALALRHEVKIVPTNDSRKKSWAPALAMAFRKGSSSLFASSGSSRSHLMPTALQAIVPLEVQAVEAKTKYLLMKSDACVRRLRHLLERRQSSVNQTALSSRLSIAPNASKREINNLGKWRSFKGDASPGISKRTNSVAVDSSVHEFIMDTNPINKHVVPTLLDKQIQSVETESWWRLKALSSLEHRVKELMDSVATSRLASPKSKLFDFSSKLEEKTQEAWGLHIAKAHSSQEITKQVSLLASKPMQGNNRVKSFRLPSIIERVQAGNRVSGWFKPSDSNERMAMLTRMKRCRSLPLFDRKFFQVIKAEESKNAFTGSTTAEINFDVLQRCQRPRFTLQMQLYLGYRLWKSLDSSKLKGSANLTDSKKDKNPEKPAHGGRTRASVDRGNHRSLQIDANDIKTKAFLRRLNHFGKVWDAVMLTVIVHFMLATPFKACFPHALSKLPGETLRGWAALDVVLDVLCLVDIGYRIRQASGVSYNAGTSSTGSKWTRIRRSIALHCELLVDVIAILPLELLLSTTGSGAPLTYEPTADSRWWTTRWLLRLNRMLLVRRVQPLSESLLQYIIYDCNVSVNEPVVSFVRAFASYLTMAHFLACLWFATSNYSMHVYVISWLSTSGMLTYITPQTSTSVETLIHFVQDIPLGRKYLRSLLFSMECITTLFYGDVVSMNELELIAEVTITIWCTYLYGALVGAQGELLDSNVRLEATFEQNLGELQLYLLENEAPKQLKRQIKAYYAHKWHRSRGEKDFQALQGTSSCLHEDVMLASLQVFAVRVEAFRHLEDPFLRALLVFLRYVMCSQGEDIVVAGDVDRSMYFIAQGKVNLKLGAAEILRERGEFFGEMTLLYGIPRLETCVALTVTELYRLDYEPYEQLLRNFPEYRAWNKMVWTSSFDKTLLSKTLKTINAKAPSGPRAMHIVDKATDKESSRLESDLRSSRIYRASMALLAQLQDMGPVETNELILKCRSGALKFVKTRLERTTATDGDMVMPIEANKQ